MARPRGFARAPVARRAKRRVAWLLGPGGDDIATLDPIAFTSSTNAILGSGVEPTIGPLVITRTRGFVEVVLTSAGAVTDGYNYAMGIGIASADAFAVGVTAVPNPFDDIDWGWLWHHMGSIRAPFDAQADNPDVRSQLIEIDSKAMRKLALNEVCFLAIVGGESGTATMTVRGATRMLFKF